MSAWRKIHTIILIGFFLSVFAPMNKSFGLSLADRLKSRVVGADPYFSSVALLLHMNGVNNATTFTDSSLNNFTLTPSAGYVISTTQTKFGSASGYFPGNSNTALALPTSSALTLNGDFTIEFWLYMASPSQNTVVLGSNYSPGGINNQIQINLGGSSIGIYNGSWNQSTAVVTISANTWHHFALSRIGSTLRFYYDGNQLGTSITMSTGVNFSGGAIGALGGYGGQWYSGYMDDFRITNGVGRYSGTTIPTGILLP